MRMLTVLLTCCAIFLAGANIFVRSGGKTGNAPAVFEKPDAAKRSQAIPATTNTAPAVVESVPAFRWDKMESADYKAYMQNLRHVGFPEELIREIIIADVNKMYAGREEPLKIPPVPEDASVAARSRKPTVEQMENLLKLREIQMEKHALLEQLLGMQVPREIIRAVNPRNYEAAEFAVRRLPAEKQQQALEIYEKEILLDDLNQAQGLRGAEELAAYRRVNEERDAALRELLTPEEFERFMMNAIPPGTEMQRRVMGMEPTDEEMLAMWKVTHEHWKEQGGVFGRWRADRVPPDQLRSADEKLAKSLQEVLGPERYLDYQLATSGTGQQLRNFASRYDLPRETLADAFRLQKEIQGWESAQQVQSGGTRLEQARTEMEKLMGPDLYRTWNEARRLEYDFQP